MISLISAGSIPLSSFMTRRRAGISFRYSRCCSFRIVANSIMADLSPTRIVPSSLFAPIFCAHNNYLQNIFYILYHINAKKEAPVCGGVCRQGASQKIFCRYRVPSAFNKVNPTWKISDILPVSVIYIPFLRRWSRTLLSVTYSILSFRLLHTSPFFILRGMRRCRILHVQPYLQLLAHTAI